ncbi:MAG: hypothetical protein LBC86_06220 [Oscillospiraceae bacterium]|nr:hypothetical protein [Oscillospiraceae bacterium]
MAISNAFAWTPGVAAVNVILPLSPKLKKLLASIGLVVSGRLLKSIFIGSTPTPGSTPPA